MIEARTDLSSNNGREFRRLIDMIYNHPLKDEDVESFRSKALDQARTYASDHGLESDEIIMIPVGSFKNIPGENSDFDFVLFVDKSENSQDLDQIYEPDFETHMDIFRVRSFNYFNNPTLGLDSENRQSLAKMVFNILFTPDEYIYGNTDQLAKLRLQLIDYIGNDKVDMQKLWYDLQIELSLNFKTFENKGVKASDKQKRFHTALEKYAAHLDEKYPKKKVGERWKHAFLGSRESLRIPSFEVIRQYLKSKNGKLSIFN